MLHLNIAFDRYASIGTVMHYILVISILLSAGLRPGGRSPLEKYFTLPNEIRPLALKIVIKRKNIKN